jgi:hypothetical protein
MIFAENALFPVLVLYEDAEMAAYETLDGLTVCSMADLKAVTKGRFAPSKIVDSRGMIWLMNGAEKLRGEGPLWGHNLFFNQTIRVRPRTEGNPEPGDLAAIKAEILRRLEVRDSLSITVRSFCAIIGKRAALALVPEIGRTVSIPEIIAILLSADFPERARFEKRN